MSQPYVMSIQALTTKSTPYQVQTFISEQEPPVCQNYATYREAVQRICELMIAPKCPITGKPVIEIYIVKRIDPEVLIEMEINHEKIIEDMSTRAIKDFENSGFKVT